jgi:leucyl aminopeptidase
VQGEESGDRAWQLPLWDEHQSCTKTRYADLANIGGGREAGTIHAAAFLSKFTNDYKWAHIDIAATASYSTPVKGGTGRPVPLISELLLNKKLSKSTYTKIWINSITLPRLKKNG